MIRRAVIVPALGYAGLRRHRQRSANAGGDAYCHHLAGVR